MYWTKFHSNSCKWYRKRFPYIKRPQFPKKHLFLTILVNEESPIIELIDIVGRPTYSNMLHVSVTVL